MNWLVKSLIYSLSLFQLLLLLSLYLLVYYFVIATMSLHQLIGFDSFVTGECDRRSHVGAALGYSLGLRVLIRRCTDP